jgi:hypothetical protein
VETHVISYHRLLIALSRLSSKIKLRFRIIIWDMMLHTQASGFTNAGLRLSGRLQASGMGLFYIRANVRALVAGSITQWSPNS